MRKKNKFKSLPSHHFLFRSDPIQLGYMADLPSPFGYGGQYFLFLGTPFWGPAVTDCTRIHNPTPHYHQLSN